ncbi:MAG: hypothetical protein NTW36_14065 [Planctomycetia bacterium]|nr:hypothetical protein [Planctomycetia bacterium]
MVRHLGGVAAILAVTLAGCGRDKGLSRVQGFVTWRNKPVPVGMITIEPDSERSNRGPQAIAAIEKGQYATRPQFGAVSGPVIVQVTGLSGIQEGESFLGVPLFPPHTFKTEISKGTSILDIVVPEKSPPTTRK